MAGVIDITGQKFGKLTVIERDFSKKDGFAYWLCQCECGNTISLRGTQLRAGLKTSCGCVEKEKHRQKVMDTTSQIGKRYGRLVVLERDLTKPIGHEHPSYWICQCDCGNKVSVILSSLTTGRTVSCGCYKNESISRRNYKDITDQRFGRLIAKENTWKKDAHNSYIWHCECDCGNKNFYCTSERLLGGNTKSCGCINSHGEVKIRKILEENNIKFKQQFIFKDLTSVNGKGYLRFDFAILDDDDNPIRLIEFDGEQHFNPESHFYSSGLVRNDEAKDEYCIAHNIPLVRIPYFDYDRIDIDSLLDDLYVIS